MTDLYEKIVSERGKLEQIVARIPGFQGYQEKQARRKADRMLRDYIAEQLDQVIRRYERQETQLLKIPGGLAMMSDSRRTKDQIKSFRDRVKTAAPGYSAMWASIKMDEEKLASLYAFDESQIRFVDRLNAAIDELESAIKAQEEIATHIQNVYDIAVEANDAFSLRNDVILNLEKYMQS